MNGVALLLAAASLAVDYSWEKSSAGQIEYMVRAEAEVIPSLVSGEEIHSDVPAEAGTVDRFRLRIGIDGNPPVFTPAAPARFGVSPDRSAMLVKNGGAAAETQDVTFGWQPGADGKLMYYVQINPNLLRTLEVGDEIQATVDRSPGPVGTFVVFAGNKQLPRVPTGTTASTTQPPSRFPLDSGASPASGQLGDSLYGGAPTSATEPATPAPSSRFGGTLADPPAASSPAPATGTTGGSRFDNPATSEPATPPGSFRFGQNNNTPATGTNTGSNSGTNDAGPGRFGNSRLGGFNPPPLDNAPATGGNASNSNPSNSTNTPGTGFRNPPAQDQGRVFENRPTLEPPASSANRNQQPAPQSPPPQEPQPNTQNYAPAPAVGSDRMAMVDPNMNRGAGFPTQQAAAPPAAPTPAEKPWWWGWMVFLFCVTCLSIGGNLYLGWTAVEFYHRYQRAVERLRSGNTVRA
jgi:hypothetical protein